LNERNSDGEAIYKGNGTHMLYMQHANAIFIKIHTHSYTQSPVSQPLNIRP